MLRVFAAPAMLTVILLAGCNSQDAIRGYTVPKSTEPVLPPKQVETVGEVRLLGAVIPTGEGKFNWFVKCVGPVETVNAAEKDIDAFLASLKIVGEAPNKKLEWKLPDGWKISPGERAMRTATFLVGPAGKTVELYISTPMGGGTLENVNRWRTGDAGLPAINNGELPSCTSEVTIDGTKALRVDLTGPGVPKDKKKMGMNR